MEVLVQTAEVAQVVQDGMLSPRSNAVCAGCGQSIVDRFLLRVMDKCWHEQCLTCCYCQCPLTHSCYHKNTRLYCRNDYQRLFGVRCYGCQMPITPSELVMRVLDRCVYHVACFCCTVCGVTLCKGDQFLFRDGHLYCRNDFEKMLFYLNGNSCDISPIFEGDDDEHFSDESFECRRGPKRPRTILTSAQRRKFRQAFEVSAKPCRKVREQLAAETGLSVRVVQVWFQNERAKVKKLARRQQQLQGEKPEKETKKKKSNDDEEGSRSDASEESGEPTKENSSNDTVPSVEDKYEPPLDPFLFTANNDKTECSGGIVNPIDKLYSMHESYFSHE